MLVRYLGLWIDFVLVRGQGPRPRWSYTRPASFVVIDGHAIYGERSG
jgi:hypothetical protein